MLGSEGEFGAPIGLANDWADNIIKRVGNYGEIFDANVGPDTPLAIERGVNALWSKVVCSTDRQSVKVRNRKIRLAIMIAGRFRLATPCSFLSRRFVR